MALRQLYVAMAVMATVATACGASETKASPSHTPTRSASQHATQSSASSAAFTSRQYKYSIALPAGWSASPGTVPWDGRSLSAEGAYADLFESSTGTVAWVAAVRTQKSLPELLAERAALDAKEHPCSRAEADEPVTLGGVPARLTAMHCPAKGGILVATTAVIHDGTVFFFAFQDPVRAASAADDLAVFKSLLSGLAFS